MKQQKGLSIAKQANKDLWEKIIFKRQKWKAKRQTWDSGRGKDYRLVRGGKSQASRVLKEMRLHNIQMGG